MRDAAFYLLIVLALGCAAGVTVTDFVGHTTANLWCWAGFAVAVCAAGASQLGRRPRGEQHILAGERD